MNEWKQKELFDVPPNESAQKKDEHWLQMADALLSEDAIVIRTTAGLDVIVPKALIRKLLAIGQMAALAKLVPTDD